MKRKEPGGYQTPAITEHGSVEAVTENRHNKAGQGIDVDDRSIQIGSTTFQ